MSYPSVDDLALDAVPPSAHATVRHRAQDFLNACEQAGLAFARWPEALGTLWYYSDFLARSAIQRPALLLELLEQEALSQQQTPMQQRQRIEAALAGVGDEARLMQQLRRVRTQEMLRIAWRDLSQQAALEETLQDLSTLAEALLDAALCWIHAEAVKRHGQPRDHQGQPQQLLVIGMGKLGGQELNFSSDIDLIFTYPENGCTDGDKSIENQLFFTRVGQRLIKVIHDTTEDGFVYRVDMRLRPFGDAGPLVMSFEALEAYYQTHGREWERYALIKARVVAGDTAQAERLSALLRPFIYRRYLDYGAFAALREMKAMINREASRRGRVGDIKLGEGGIREIEFIGQAFQLIRGGRVPALQARSIITVIEQLGRLGQLPAYAVEQLLAAYRFLRRAENHLQMVADQQTHSLPTEPYAQEQLARSMGFADWPAFSLQLKQHQQRVQEHFAQVFAAPQSESEGESTQLTPPAHKDMHSIWEGSCSPQRAQAMLEERGFSEAKQTLEQLHAFRESATVRALSSTGRTRLDRLMPLLLGAVAEQGGAPDQVLHRLLRLLQGIARRSVYLALLMENPLALSQLVRLCAASSWIADHLARHPLLLDELLDPRSLYAPPDREGLKQAVTEELLQVPADDMEQLMDRLRLFRQVQVLKVAAADIMGVLPLMKVSDHLSWIAEVVLEQVLQLVNKQLLERHGAPRCQHDAGIQQPGFAIIGYGKLGGLEFGYGSDLDIVFLHNIEGESLMTEGVRPMNSSEFFGRVGQRLLHVLGAFTPAGRLYEVDTRLRPSGESGLLVSSLTAFADYQHHSAWTWEHQALVRARPVAGDAQVARQFLEIRAEILAKARDRQALATEVRTMREKMWAEHSRTAPGYFDLKRDPGGITDIEFIAQYYVLAYANEYPELLTWPDTIRILETLASTALITPDQAQFLIESYRRFRDRIHRQTLQEQPAIVAEHEPCLSLDQSDMPKDGAQATSFAHRRAEIQSLWQRIF
ncbi:bifunctional [glutamate--ammonia ligase]-adenylyl-L-tyrosine phosphorylase/[glutamate--ammonia-ligase] adenylyltransferase [Thiorhodospira sibirica]|uniref:bifunctional [glutamate--ammonia ligase]-adenylyl-L-tyrosine phosphorylase/[glutamate--ammonia-ligase] adenylyltransferase n=1 Tax=Thiorhodospira sibirica TaxID=154347 RepID=UPI00022C2311